MAHEGVKEALELLLGELNALHEELGNQAKEALSEGLYDLAKRLVEQTQQVGAFRERVKVLAEEWERVLAQAERPRLRRKAPFPEPREAEPKRRRRPKGSHTPQAAFVMPLLEALEERGGSGHADEILEAVYHKVKDSITEADRQVLDCGEVRWRKAVHWCRFRLAREGLIDPDSPRGLWQITESGRSRLRRLRGLFGASVPEDTPEGPEGEQSGMWEE